MGIVRLHRALQLDCGDAGVLHVAVELKMLGEPGGQQEERGLTPPGPGGQEEGKSGLVVSVAGLHRKHNRRCRNLIHLITIITKDRRLRLKPALVQYADYMVEKT